MNILITGGTGFIGKELCQKLIDQNHTLSILSRSPHQNTQAVTYYQTLANFDNLNGFDAIINLAGEPIFDKKWTTKQKDILRASRINITQQLVDLIKNSNHPPHTFISGSATGFYGDLPKQNNAKYYDELTACGDQFAAQLCADWENTALKANSDKTRVCLIRTGIVLNKEGGALKRMLPLYKLGLGGKIGNGSQYWSWISLEDHVNAILFLLNNPNSKGAYNFVSPEPITHAEFNRILSQVVKRPAFFHAPEIMLKMILGERSQLLLDNQPLVPQKLLNEGFTFQDNKLTPSLFL
ncbi:TIGR01777 family oxidoreductase [Otariodibacter oris]|uniref:TIGR01777 family protein n=1 Tax=Otariodibacter oris TaxID=1032623 RepID=A0A420XHF6_9PAST|nr:TIGR01777 family oxidoreductase [Otariodibacter oris]QGM81022.1 TIGR01777 family protein [Otariodibacter oris]RKR76794.1 hypothetical protein DES31_0102 [Otariodibacter oris]